MQAFVRIKNIEHKKHDLFEVHLFCWETIVDLIDENKQTHDYYLKSQNYKTNKGVSITFQDGSTEITCKPKFKQTITHYLQKIVPAFGDLYNSELFVSLRTQQQIAKSFAISSMFGTTVNLSFFDFFIRITNTGTEPIEEYKVFLKFEGDIQELADTNEKSMTLPIITHIVPTTHLWPESLEGKIVPRKSILVGDDIFSSQKIFIKPFPKEGKITIKWKIISKDFKDEGELFINVTPEIEREQKDILVEDPFQVRSVESDIEDFIIDKKDKDNE